MRQRNNPPLPSACYIFIYFVKLSMPNITLPILKSPPLSWVACHPWLHLKNTTRFLHVDCKTRWEMGRVGGEGTRDRWVCFHSTILFELQLNSFPWGDGNKMTCLRNFRVKNELTNWCLAWMVGREGVGMKEVTPGNRVIIEEKKGEQKLGPNFEHFPGLNFPISEAGVGETKIRHCSSRV